IPPLEGHMKTLRLLTTALAIPFVIASAQTQIASSERSGANSDTAKKDTTTASAAAIFELKPIVIQHLRPSDQRGLNVFEPPKNDPVAYAGFKLDLGAAFTQQFQG